MILFHIYKEGDVKYGFNFYPLSSKHSVGFYLKFWWNRAIHVRYSKVTGYFSSFHVRKMG